MRVAFIVWLPDMSCLSPSASPRLCPLGDSADEVFLFIGNLLRVGENRCRWRRRHRRRRLSPTAPEPKFRSPPDSKDLFGVESSQRNPPGEISFLLVSSFLTLVSLDGIKNFNRGVLTISNSKSSGNILPGEYFMLGISAFNGAS